MIKFVYENISAEDKLSIREILSSETMMFDIDSEIKNVCAIDYTNDRKIRGFTSVYVQKFSMDLGYYYFFNIYYSKKYRNRMIPRKDVNDTLMYATINGLKKHESDKNINGIVAVLHNQKISKSLMRDIAKWTFYKINDEGRYVWYYKF